MDREELDKRVEEEAGAARGRFEGSPTLDMRAWIAAVRPLVERLSATEDARDGLADNMRLAQERIRETETERDRAEDAAAKAACERAEAQGALESTRAELARETEARRAAEREVERLKARIVDHCARIIAQDQEIAALRDERVRWMARATEAEDRAASLSVNCGKLEDAIASQNDGIAALEGERDEALSTARRYGAALTESIAREARLRAALRDAEGAVRALSRMALGVDVAGRTVVEVGA